MNAKFINKLAIQNLLWLHDQVEAAIRAKDPNEILEYLIRLDGWSKKVNTQAEFETLTKHIELLEKAANP
jgi:hypothetical protein